MWQHVLKIKELQDLWIVQYITRVYVKILPAKGMLITRTLYVQYLLFNLMSSIPNVRHVSIISNNVQSNTTFI